MYCYVTINKLEFSLQLESYRRSKHTLFRFDQHSLEKNIFSVQPHDDTTILVPIDCKGLEKSCDGLFDDNKICFQCYDLPKSNPGRTYIKKS